MRRDGDDEGRGWYGAGMMRRGGGGDDEGRE